MRSLSPARKALVSLLLTSSVLSAIGLFAPVTLSMPETWALAVRVLGLMCAIFAIALIVWTSLTGRSL